MAERGEESRNNQPKVCLDFSTEKKKPEECIKREKAITSEKKKRNRKEYNFLVCQQIKLLIFSKQNEGYSDVFQIEPHLLLL